MRPSKRIVSLAAGWLLALGGLAGLASADDGRSAELFDLCAQCHGSEGEGNPLALAPAIAGLEEWYVATQLHNFRSGLRGLNPEDRPGLRMYPMSQSIYDDADVALLASYVASLPSVDPKPTIDGGNPEVGKTLYVTCAACHGPDGKGNKDLNAPRLVDSSDWYLYSTLQRYKAGIRGGNPKNQNSVMMRGMAMSLADDQAIKDVVAYIETLSN